MWTSPNERSLSGDLDGEVCIIDCLQNILDNRADAQVSFLFAAAAAAIDAVANGMLLLEYLMVSIWGGFRMRFEIVI